MARTPIPWGRLAAEFVVIVVGVLVALGADAWWDGRQRLAEVSEIVTGLREDFVREREVLESRLEEDQRAIGLIDYLFGLGGRPASEIDVPRADAAFGVLRFSPTWDPSTATLDALISSGRLELIEDFELREALSAWGQTVDEVRDNELLIRDFTRETLVPYLASRGVPLTRTSGRRRRPSSLVSSDEAAGIYADILADIEFRSLMSYRRGWTAGSVFERRTAIEELDAILELLDR